MRRAALLLGIVLLLGFVGYGFWHVFLREQVDLLTYKRDVGELMTAAKDVMKRFEKERDPGILKSGVEDLRKRYSALLERTGESDRHRPSFRKTDDVVVQLEFAAQDAGSPDVVKSRFRAAEDGLQQVTNTLGTPQDSPQ